VFVIGFGGELVAERARLVSFVHDLNLLAALGIRLVLVPRRAARRSRRSCAPRALRSRYSKGLRITDAHSLLAVKHAAGVLRVELEALLSQGLPNSPMAGRADPRCIGQLHHRAPDRDPSTASITSSPAKCARSTAPQSRAGSTRARCVLVPHIGYSPTGKVFNLAWEDVAESVAIALKADKLLLLTDRLPAVRKDEPLSELTCAGGRIAAAQGRADQASLLEC
jgi:amino-acid N-acetyltransferase